MAVLLVFSQGKYSSFPRAGGGMHTKGTFLLRLKPVLCSSTFTICDLDFIPNLNPNPSSIPNPNPDRAIQYRAMGDQTQYICVGLYNGLHHVC